MSDFPKLFSLPDQLIHITTLSTCCVAGGALSNGGDAGATYPSANVAIFVPFRLTRPYTFSTVFWNNDTVVSGNIDVGVYSVDGTKIISTGSTAQSGTSAIQSVSVTSTELGSGLFYLSVAMDNTTGKLRGITYSVAARGAAIGMAQMASAFPLPTTATFATMSVAFLPFIGITGRSVI